MQNKIGPEYIIMNLNPTTNIPKWLHKKPDCDNLDYKNINFYNFITDLKIINNLSYPEYLDNLKNYENFLILLHNLKLFETIIPPLTKTIFLNDIILSGNLTFGDDPFPKIEIFISWRKGARLGCTINIPSLLIKKSKTDMLQNISILGHINCTNYRTNYPKEIKIIYFNIINHGYSFLNQNEEYETRSNYFKRAVELVECMIKDVKDPYIYLIHK
jgi:hypothetical protein